MSAPDVTPAVDVHPQLDRNGLEVLTRARCLELLATVPIGRVVYTDRALPAIRPVNFAVVDDQVIIRSTGFGALTAATRGSVVAFEADYFDDGPAGAWSVTIIGRAREVTDPERLRGLADLDLRPWTPVLQGKYVTIDIEAISGRRIPS